MPTLSSMMAPDIFVRTTLCARSDEKNCIIMMTSSNHCSDVVMSAMASQITSLTIVYSTVYSGADQRKHQSSAPLAFVRGITRLPVNSPHRGPVTRKMLPFDDVIMVISHAGKSEDIYPWHKLKITNLIWQPHPLGPHELTWWWR